jgi:pyrroline-5-carboxylate reductase
MRITFIGGGNMASALIGGLLRNGHSAADLVVVEPAADQRNRLAKRFGVTTFARATGPALDCDVVVIAVKPQQMHEAATAMAPNLRGQLVISVAAGIRAADLSRWLDGHRRIVRCMPNTPALIGEGVTGLAGSADLSSEDRQAAETILGAVGQTVWVDHESLLDAVTAVSGSGPAYVFYFMEAMHQAALGLGLNDQQARQLTLATFTGAARLAAQSQESPAELRERVTSKGGTTAAALSVMGEHEVQQHIVQALAAAQKRSVELGDEFGADT